MSVKSFVFAALAATTLATTANAAVVIDHSVDTINMRPGNLVSNVSTSQNFLTKFTLAANTTLTGADIYSEWPRLENVLGRSATIKFRLDNGGVPMATDHLNFSANISAVDNLGSTTLPMVKRLHVDFGAKKLAAGTYWFGMSGTTQEIGLSLEHFVPGANPLYLGDKNNFSRIQADTKMAFNLYGSTAGVPEPASWALMLFGFGAVGFSLRSNRRTQTAAA